MPRWYGLANIWSLDENNQLYEETIPVSVTGANYSQARVRGRRQAEMRAKQTFGGEFNNWILLVTESDIRKARQAGERGEIGPLEAWYYDSRGKLIQQEMATDERRRAEARRIRELQKAEREQRRQESEYQKHHSGGMGLERYNPQGHVERRSGHWYFGTQPTETEGETE